MAKKARWTVLGMVIYLVLSFDAQSQEKENKIPTSEPSGRFRIILEGKWGYVDKTCKVVIKPQFNAAWDFSEGMAAVLGDKLGYIDKTGKYVCEPE